MAIPLSILDVSPVTAGTSTTQVLRNSVDLARFADARGYKRFWFAEHHNTPSIASTTPEIMIGQVARETRHLRVGSGGVMLPNHAPLKVAESFKLLEALYPGRIDLGIGRAPGTDGRTALALRRSRDAMNAEDFPQNLADLQHFASGKFPEGHPFQSVAAYPQDVALPPIWLLGSSDFSARLASQVGMGFAFAHHINGELAVPVMNLYRQDFTPSESFPEPHAILAASVITADTDEEAEDLSLSVAFSFYSLYAGLEHGPLKSPEEIKAYPFSPQQESLFQSIAARHIVGSPATVHARLTNLVEQTKADELMVLSMIYDHDARLHSYDLLAKAFQVQPVDDLVASTEN
ncbi:LLM class flavin-dependent oxidoreductase [Phototrophicus methaneseepsis]|uniref:LLM class flavin-dependent oxidoreductase n=1 Tax=Phototrophicus methaneseepsis TaxID=2710758 RepID=A0A7S8E744_9CHLR|nr:LLM class flavin-dependent oxidoreductase [Phototrophicus methaneseepsis]QPC81595.1 LLM class flavin-dependent oxidoreductase [Phototrophicus methaneseepsis]